MPTLLQSPCQIRTSRPRPRRAKLVVIRGPAKTMSPDEIVIQLQQIVTTMQQIVKGSAELAERVHALEDQSGEKVGLLTSLQGHLHLLLETYQKQVAAQEATNRTLLEALGTLEARLEILESGSGNLHSLGDRPN